MKRLVIAFKETVRQNIKVIVYIIYLILIGQLRHSGKIFLNNDQC